MHSFNQIKILNRSSQTMTQTFHFVLIISLTIRKNIPFHSQPPNIIFLNFLLAFKFSSSFLIIFILFSLSNNTFPFHEPSIFSFFRMMMMLSTFLLMVFFFIHSFIIFYDILVLDIDTVSDLGISQ